jgi:hypothetical protein
MEFPEKLLKVSFNVLSCVFSSYMNWVAVVIDVDGVCTDVYRRKFCSKSTVNVACNSHRQLTKWTADTDGQLSSTAARDLERKTNDNSDRFNAFSGLTVIRKVAG